MHSNPIIAISANSAVNLNSFLSDTTAPNILSFNFDLNSEILSLMFDETVDLSTLMISGIYFSREASPSAVFYTLSNGTLLSSNPSTEASISLPQSEVNALKQLEICLTADTCYLYVASNFITDTSSNGLLAILADNALRVTNYNPDSISPMLVEYTSFDFNLGSLTLSFSEVIRTSTFEPTSLNLYNTFSSLNSTTNYSLSSSAAILQNGLTLHISLSEDDVNHIKLDTRLCISSSTCIVRFGSLLITDMSGNPVTPSLVGDMNSIFQPSTYVFDTTRPNLKEWSIVMEDPGYVILVFDEIVSEVSFNPSELVFQDAFAASDTFSPSSSTFMRSVDGLSITVKFSQFDLDSIKSHQLICKTLDDCYLTFNANLLSDIMLLAVNPQINGISSVRASAYIPDTENPYLLNFTRFSLESRSFDLYFSEPMDILTIVYTNIIILKQQYTDAYIRLSGGDIAWTDTLKRQVRISLTREDYRTFLQWHLLAVSYYTTYVALYSSSISDMAGNHVIETSTPIQLDMSGFIADTSTANFLAFDIDLTQETISLEFDDIVFVDSLNAKTITLYSSQLMDNPYKLDRNAYDVLKIVTAPVTAVLDYYQFVTDPGVIVQGLAAPYDNYIATFQIDVNDLNAIKKNPQLVTNRENTFIQISQNTLLDTYLRNISSVNRTLQVRNFTPDTISPTIFGFDLDLNASLLFITFNEIVNLTTFDTTKLIIQNSASPFIINTTLISPQFAYYQFTESTVPYNDTMQSQFPIYLGYDDANALKSMLTLAQNRSTTYLSAGTGLFLDTNSNVNLPMNQTSALLVTHYTADFSQPYLVYFDLNLNNNYLLLYFNEAVDPSTFQIDEITLQSHPDSRLSAVNHTLRTDSTVTTTNYFGTVYIALSDEDQLILKDLNVPLAKSSTSTYLSLTKQTISDYRGYSVIPISPYAAIQVHLFYEGMLLLSLTNSQLIHFIFKI